MRHCRPLATFLVLAVVWLAASETFAETTPPVDYDIRLTVDPDSAAITVDSRIIVSGRRTIAMSAAPWLRLGDITIDDKSAKTARTDKGVTLTLPTEGRHVIALTGRGTIPGPETAQGRPGSSPVASTDGVYLPAWSGWMPQLRGTAATYALTITTPAAYRAAATGSLNSEKLGPQENVARFEIKQGVEPPTVFAGPYEVAEKRSGSLRLRTYFHRAAASLSEGYLNAAERFIRMYEKEIGPYPFTDFHMVSAPLPVGLGFPSATYVDKRILRLPFMRGRSLAHEVLHNWWGNGVLTDYRTGNWSEGLTTYMADHALAANRSPKAGTEMRLGWLRDYAALPASRDIPVNRFVSKRHDAAQVVGYGKAAFIFHMLKHEVGADRFTAAIQRFWREKKFKLASWEDIRTVFEAETGEDLGWFFDQWVTRRGAPELSLGLSAVMSSESKHGLTLALKQTAPAYRLKVPVLVETASGPQRFDIRLDGISKTEVLELNAKPKSLRIDPDHTLFRKLLPGEAPPILRDVLLDKSAKTLVLHDDPESRQVATDLAARMFRAQPDMIDADKIRAAGDVPLLVLGTKAQIDRFIVKSRTSRRPAELSSDGTGRAWTARRRANGKAVLFVETDTAEALRALMRPLPHYRSKSFIIFEGRRAIENGVWTPTGGPLIFNFG